MLEFLRKSGKPKPLEPQAVYVSETGLVRTDNQDSVMISSGRGVFCVADGVGGAEAGAKASAIVCREVSMMTRVDADSLESRIAAVRRGIVEANEVIFVEVGGGGTVRMGSTAAVLVLDPNEASRAGVVWVGDSRVYRIRHGLAKLLTRDHRAVDGNLLTRAVGCAVAVSCDACEVDVAPGDRFLVCTDGVHGVISDGRLALFAAGGSIESAAERIAAEVVKAGAPDNYTFILVAI